MPVTNYYTIDGQMIGYKDAGGRKDFLTDALGSVTAEVDQTGATKTFDGRYTPYGGDLSSSGTRGRYGWIGTWGYRETRLAVSSHYVRARHYNWKSGKWITSDPLWPSESGYVYVQNSPIIRKDPSGLSGLPGCQGNDIISRWVQIGYKKFCERMKSADLGFLGCLVKCNSKRKPPVSISCLSQFCDPISSNNISCGPCELDVEARCPADCFCRTYKRPSRCGSTDCESAMPRRIRICTNNTSSSIESQCSCLTNWGRISCDTPPLGSPPQTLFHEMAHACTSDCAKDEDPVMQAKNKEWGACVEACLRK